jgi:dipeptidyl aminopeptidase/acylaminoacyl peptidase
MNGHGHPMGFVKHNADLSSEVVMGGHVAGTFNSKGGGGPEFVGLSNDATPSLLVEAPGPTGITGLYRWVAPGGVSTALFADQNYDIADTIKDEHTGRIIDVAYVDDRMRAHYFDPAIQTIQTRLEKTLPNQAVSIVSKDAAGASYLVVSEAPRNPPTLFLYTPATHKLMQLLQAYPGLQQSDLGEMKPYPYKARDGLDIHAYLTLPPGKNPHNLPTIIMPHGGPEARDMLGFDWVAQFLSSRGYAVLQPNFRGSSGYGRHFVTAGDGEWANKVQFDVQDGVKKLVAEGVSDPKRTCIFGWSYGGYMSLAGATFSPDPYVCAAAMAGVYDLDRLNYSGTKFESMDTSIWERRMGVSSMDSSAMEAQSPSEHADQVKIPILLLHSDKDVPVPIEQSEIEERALKRADKSVQFIRISGDDHYLSYAPTRIQMLTELEKFMAANIGH